MLLILFLLSLSFSFIKLQQPNIHCAKYQCDDTTSSSCITVHTGINSVGYNNVTLSHGCPNGESCFVFMPWDTFTVEPKDLKVQCGQIFTFTLRYPGEYCSLDSDCFGSHSHNEIGKCINQKCTGMAEGDTCFDTAHCLKGLYCNKNTKKCAKQRQIGESCLSSFDCINNIMCHNSTCSIEPFTLPLGAVIGKDPIDQFQCVFGTSHGNLCSSFNQTVEDFITCNYNEKCNYTTSDGGLVLKDCGCGYNSEGQGYCPMGHNKSNLL
jgi:hypothetical protein